MLRQRGTTCFATFCLLFAQLACGLFDGPGGDGSPPTSSARPAPHFKPGFNLFSPEQDIELGRRSAQQIAQEAPLLRDERLVNYVRQLGTKLASKAPGHPFTYHFEVVATKDINAFALPGGYIFVYAGTIAEAKNEGELAGVMAHEIAHVALRHGTNQASKAYLAKAGIDILRVIGGGNADLDQAINQIGGAGANMLFLKFGRTAETQADLEGAHIMANAGYDARDMANFFKTLASKGGQRTPEFLSDHPDPGNRYTTITEALPQLKISSNPTRDTEEFRQAKARLTGGSQIDSKKEQPARLGPRDPNDMEPAQRPSTPSGSFTEFQAKDGSFAIQYPANWDALVADDANMIFAPKGAYGQTSNGIVVTHGIFIGAVAPQSSDLRTANEAFVRQQVEMNPDFRVVQAPQAVTLGGRQAFATVVAGASTVTGVVEVDVIYTTATADGRLFYLITMAPEDELGSYKTVFEQVINSLRLAR